MSDRKTLLSNSLLFLLLAGCPRTGGVPEGDDSMETGIGTDDTDTDAVETGDGDDTSTDTNLDSGDDTGDVKPAWLWPDYMNVYMVLGVNDGEISNFSYENGDESTSYLAVQLMDERYFDSENEVFLCAMYWLISGENTSPDGTLPMWDLSYAAYWESDGCYNMDPDAYGWDPIDSVDIADGDLSIEAMSEVTLDAATEIYGEDYFSQEPYFAANASLDGLDAELDYYRQYWSDMQRFYGLAYTADENMYCTFNENLSTEASLAGERGVYYVISHYQPAPTGW